MAPEESHQVQMPPVVQSILDMFQQQGDLQYGTEQVTQLQHALQCGELARRERADATLVVAALLHDVGHLLGSREAGREGGSLDDQHESLGWRFLQRCFGPAVADPVRLHVLAKRYLCTIDERYEGHLSPTSRQSFHDQGGVMTASERAAFEAEPYFRESLELRRWDDAAKDPGARMPTMVDFLPELKACTLPT